MSASDATAIPLCVYAISGWYGPIPRYLFYATLILFILSRKISWLVGVAMVYGCVAAIHGCAVAAGRGRGAIDLDVIPIFAIVGEGIIVISTVLFWSTTARSGLAGLALFMFTLILWAGVLASTASLKAVPKPSHCGFTWIPESPNCTRTCQNITLLMRDQQTTIPFVFLWRNLLYDYSGWFAFYSSFLVLMGYAAYCSMRSDEDPWDYGRRKYSRSSTGIQKQWARSLCGASFFPLIGIPHIIIMEFIMLGHKGMPVHANYSTVGQWGILVGAFVGGSLLQAPLLFVRADSKIGADPESAADLETGTASESAAGPETGAEKGIGATLESGVDQEIGAASESAVDPEVGAALESAVDPEVGTTLESAVDPEIGAASESAVDPEIGAASESAVDPEIGAHEETKKQDPVLRS